MYIFNRSWGSRVVQWLALLHHSKKIQIHQPAEAFEVCILSLCLHGFSLDTLTFSQPKTNIGVSLISNSKLAVGVKVRVMVVFISLVADWQPV